MTAFCRPLHSMKKKPNDPSWANEIKFNWMTRTELENLKNGNLEQTMEHFLKSPKSPKFDLQSITDQVKNKLKVQKELFECEFLNLFLKNRKKPKKLLTRETTNNLTRETTNNLTRETTNNLTRETTNRIKPNKLLTRETNNRIKPNKLLTRESMKTGVFQKEKLNLKTVSTVSS